MTSEKTINLGIIGVGQVAEFKHMRLLSDMPDVCLHSIADTDPERLEHVGNRYAVERRYSDHNELLGDRDVDAVAIITPPAEHVALAIDAILAGKHVIIEKPLCLDLGEARNLIAEAKKSPVIVMQSFHMRWHRLILEARTMVNKGQLGEIESIRSVWNSPINYDGSLAPWRYDRTQGGGALLELSVHHYDLWRFLLGAEIEEVSAISRYTDFADETAVVIGRMSSGSVATAVFSEKTSHNIEVEICGTEGRLAIQCLRFDGLEFFPKTGVPGGIKPRIERLTHLVRELPHGIRSNRPGGEYMISYEKQWRHFIDCVRHGKPVACTLDDGIKAVQAALAAVESATRGRHIRVADATSTVMPIPSGS